MMDEKEAFAAAVQVLPPAEARTIRARFHETFLDTSSDFYRERNVGALIYHPSGKGNQRNHMWDCLRAYRRATWDEIKAAMANSREVLVMWDIMDPNPYATSEEAHPFEPDTVIACRPAVLEVGLHLLPEDLYIFDRTIRWAGILTHEPWVDGVEQYKYLAFERDRPQTIISTGERWEFIQSEQPDNCRDSPGLEIWLDDRHFADLIDAELGEPMSFRFFPPREGWTWQVPGGRLQEVIGRALEAISLPGLEASDYQPGANEQQT